MPSSSAALMSSAISSRPGGVTTISLATTWPAATPCAAAAAAAFSVSDATVPLNVTTPAERSWVTETSSSPRASRASCTLSTTSGASDDEQPMTRADARQSGMSRVLVMSPVVQVDCQTDVPRSRLQAGRGGAWTAECEQGIPALDAPSPGTPGRYDGWMQGWRLEHTYAGLPALFHARAEPAPVASPRMLVFNTGLAEAMGLDAAALDTPEGAAVLAGNVLPPGAHPIAQAYAGHQFGYFTTLGDGRAILLGEQITPDGRRLDVQLKGAGRTRYSRRGDGRAAIGPMLREYVISEAMHALGIPTTRSLAVVATGEPVYRERVLSGAVLTRVAASHLRVGTFEWAAAEGSPDAVRALADYARGRHYAAAVGEEAWRDLCRSEERRVGEGRRDRRS